MLSSVLCLEPLMPTLGGTNYDLPWQGTLHSSHEGSDKPGDGVASDELSVKAVTMANLESLKGSYLWEWSWL